MWQSFTAKNFRGFHGLVVNDLARVNLIAGKNNMGKTAVLEAMQIHSYPRNWALPFEVNGQRGLAYNGMFSQELVSLLFFDRRAANGLELSSRDDKGLTRNQCICLVITVRDFCAEHDISEATFYSWRRTLVQRDQARSSTVFDGATGPNVQSRSSTQPPARFVPLTIVPAPVSNNDDLQVVLDSGHVIRVPAGFDGDTLRKLLVILQRQTAETLSKARRHDGHHVQSGTTVT